LGLPSSSSSESEAKRDLKFDLGGGAALAVVGRGGGAALIVMPPPRGGWEERSVVRFAPASTDPLRKDSRNFSPFPLPTNDEPEGDKERRLKAPLPGVGDVGLSRPDGIGGGKSIDPARIERRMLYLPVLESMVETDPLRFFLKELSESESLVTCFCTFAVYAPGFCTDGAGGIMRDCAGFILC